MKYLCLITLILAISYSWPQYIIKQRELHIMEQNHRDEYKLKEMQIKIDENGLLLLKRLMESNNGNQKSYY